MQETFETQKREAAKRAALKVPANIRLGLGSGSTSEIFIQELAKLPHAKTLTLVSSSKSSQKLAEKLGLHVAELNSFESLDLAVDGADAVDAEGNLLKGFGGAMTREKIVASMAKELWILIDGRKRCQKLPLNRVPCEILPCACGLILATLKQRGFEAVLRKKDQELWITDNDGWILDVSITDENLNLRDLDLWLHTIPGIIETGLFIGFKIHLFDGQSSHLIA
jgi:ribose 5-phosphate isomerase A